MLEAMYLEQYGAHNAAPSYGTKQYYCDFGLSSSYSLNEAYQRISVEQAVVTGR